MRYAVLADIHANLDALRAVLGRLRRERVDGYLVAGDLVGYGPYPNECVEMVAGLGATCVAGNHDLMALGRLSDDRCIPLARTILRWTREVLNDGARSFLEGLPTRAEAPGGVVVTHGSFRDPSVYVTRPAQAAVELDHVRREHPRARILVVGHTHRPWACDRLGRVLTSRSSLALPAAEMCLLNPGAVGQSREWRAWARFLLLDLDTWTATFSTVGYDVRQCRNALRKNGLPAQACHLRPSVMRRGRRLLRGLTQRSGSGA